MDTFRQELSTFTVTFVCIILLADFAAHRSRREAREMDRDIERYIEM